MKTMHMTDLLLPMQITTTNDRLTTTTTLKSGFKLKLNANLLN
jgi:hypothetical protein